MKKLRSYFFLLAAGAVLLTACNTKQTGTTPTDTPNDVTLTPTMEPEDLTGTPTEKPGDPTKEPGDPTEAPTTVPTKEPTKKPTAAPTEEPTKAPTKEPTKAPAVPAAAPKETELKYDFNDLTYMGSYGTVYEVKSDGSIELQYEGQYQEIKLAVPDDIDMSYCYQVTVKALSSYAPLSVKLYDENGTQVFVEYYCKADAVTEFQLMPNIADTVTGIGLMALDTVDDFSKYKVTVYSITFHMDDDYVTAGQPVTLPLEETYSPVVTDGTNLELEARWKEKFAGLKLSDTLKKIGYDAPVMTQRLGADPYAIVYEGRVYLYMTGDVVEYASDGVTVKNNSYSKINTLNVISSDDLVNWTDHGTIYAAGRKGAATWGNNSWAPAVAYKEIDGKTKFFVYFANGGNGIGVLTSDSPTGPFTDPIGKALISRSTPNCANVDWLFDPAVLVDDDGSAYIYFGGGVPAGKVANPGTGRVAKLGADMISIEGTPVSMDTPYLFEDSGINKINGKYYYSYCSNWQVPQEATAKLGFHSAEIVYMTSDNPMGPFTLGGVILKNPGNYFGCYGNNHHCLFEFNGDWYITYHTQILESPLGISGGYRCTHITKLQVNSDGTINLVQSASRDALTQAKSLNPYEKAEAETMATMGGLTTVQEGEESKKCGSGNMALTEIHSGDWLALYGVDFGKTGATKFMAAVKTPEGQTGAIQIRLDSLNGEVAGYLDVGEGADGTYHEVTVDLLKKVTGEHNLIFVFCGEGYLVDYWQFLQ